MSTNLLLINNESKNSLIETAEKADMSTKKNNKTLISVFFRLPQISIQKSLLSGGFSFYLFVLVFLGTVKGKPHKQCVFCGVCVIVFAKTAKNKAHFFIKIYCRKIA